MITISNLNKSYKKNHVLRDISLELPKSGVVALLGPNGSGKTTLLKCFLGMVLPDSGDLVFDGRSVLGQYEYRTKVSYLSQIARFPENLTVRELITLMKEIKSGETREATFIKVFNLQKELDKKMGSLSGGTRQKVNITLALMHDDPLIILDEPSTGLDPLSLQELKKFVVEERERGKLILITTHILSLAEDLADDILFLLEGDIYFNGSLKDLLNDQEEDSLEKAIAHILRSTKEYGHA
ncbi:MAG: Cu-processing system ATP-binding protein [Saprospiraceae bacterium]|jgi:Cu-processing system ATP-binding protein|tara:strand:- start:618 stop:1337 length:720 start_codon:yes stop_codon:yes gene_type:complete